MIDSDNMSWSVKTLSLTNGALKVKTIGSAYSANRSSNKLEISHQSYLTITRNRVCAENAT